MSDQDPAGRGKVGFNNWKFAIPIGIGVGVAIGVALGNIAVGIAIGAGVGVTFAMSQRRRS